ncbi:MAG: type II secretion system protein [Phycisphaeraceae bacterium]
MSTWGRSSQAGFTLVELLVVMAIIGLLIAIMLPALGKVQDMTRRLTCANQLRQQGLAMYVYADDHGDELPPADAGSGVSWDDLLSPYLENRRVGLDLTEQQVAKSSASVMLQCPDDPMVESAPESAAARSYAMPRSMHPDADAAEPTLGVGRTAAYEGNAREPFRLGVDVPDPAGTFLVVEWPAKWPGGLSLAPNRQGGARFAAIDRPQQQMGKFIEMVGSQFLFTQGMSTHGKPTDRLFNYLYADGHVRAMRPKDTLGIDGTMAGMPTGPWTRDAKD